MPWHKLLIVPPRGEILVEVLSQRMVGYATHWDVEEKRTVYCTGEGVCPYCDIGWEPGWYGYLAVRAYPSRALRLLGIPRVAYIECPRLAELDGQLRGAVLKLHRLLEHARGPLHVQIGNTRVDPDSLPNGWDLAADLRRRFGYRDRQALKKGQVAAVEAIVNGIGRPAGEAEHADP